MNREVISLEVLAERLANFMSEERITRNQVRDDHKTLLREVTDLKLAVQKQNGNVAEVMRQLAEVQAWQTQHNLHHGLNDEAIGKRLYLVEEEKHDDKVRRDVWKAQLGMFLGGGGLMGLIVLALTLLGLL